MITYEMLIELTKRPTYIKILLTLCKEPASITKLVRETGAKRTRIKRYLNDLMNEGLIEEEILGSHKVYILTDKGKALCQ